MSGAAMVRLGAAVLAGSGALLASAAFRHWRRALELGLEPEALWTLVPLGLGLGWFKGKRVMRRALAANVAWLRNQDQLGGPVPVWRVFQPWLLGLIASMVAGSILFKQLSAHWPAGLAGLATLDLAVALALWISLPLHLREPARAVR